MRVHTSERLLELDELVTTYKSRAVEQNVQRGLDFGKLFLFLEVTPFLNNFSLVLDVGVDLIEYFFTYTLVVDSGIAYYHCSFYLLASALHRLYKLKA